MQIDGQLRLDAIMAAPVRFDWSGPRSEDHYKVTFEYWIRPGTGIDSRGWMLCEEKSQQ